ALGRRVGRHPGRLLLLVEARAFQPVGTPLEGEEAVFHVRLERREDLHVEAEQVELRVALVRPEDLVGGRDRERNVGESGARLSFRAHGRLSGRTTSAACLSSRRPRKTGWRNRVSSVHSWNATCATRRGSSHVAPLIRGGSAKGAVFRTSAWKPRWRVAS